MSNPSPTTSSLAPTSNKTGICTICKRTIAMTKSGVLRSHGRANNCPGSHRPPAAATKPLSTQATAVAPTSPADNQAGRIPSCSADELVGNPVRSVRFLPRELVPLAAESLSIALSSVSKIPDDLYLGGSADVASASGGALGSPTRFAKAAQRLAPLTDRGSGRTAET